MPEQSSAAGAQIPRRVGVGPGAGVRRGGSRGREQGTRRQEDWSSFAKGLLSGVFITLALGFVALGAWFRSEDGSPHRGRLPETLGGISAAIGNRQDEAPAPSRAAAADASPGPAAGDPLPSTASGSIQAETRPAQPQRAPDELEAAGVDELLNAQQRNRKVIGQAGKLLKAIGGSSK